MVEKARVSHPKSMKSGELALPLDGAASESLPWWYRCRKAGGLLNSAMTQAQIQGLELVQPNIYPMYELLENLKGPVLQNKH